MIALSALLAAAAAAVMVRPPSGHALAVRAVGPGRPSSGRKPMVALATWLATWRRRRRAASRRAATVELCRALAAELHAGAMPAVALERAAASVPGICEEAARSARLGGDVASALVAASVRPGAGGLTRVAAIWSVSAEAGSGLAEGCERIADWLAEEESLRREVASQLAGARASARLLAGLPIFGLALGSALGARPINVLIGTPYGRICLVLGLALAALGLWWTERLAQAVENRV